MTSIISNYTLTDAASVVIPASTNNAVRSAYKLLATAAVGNTRQISFAGAGAENEVVDFEFIQDGTGSRLLTYGSNIAFGTDVPSPTLTTTANKRDFFSFRYSKDLAKWLCTRVIKGY